jgi:hypothetical protein
VGYLYDVWINYAAADEALVLDTLERIFEDESIVGRSLRVAVGQEEIRPGEPLVSGYERMVDQSQYTIVVVSEAYLHDEWGQYGTNLLQYADAGTGEHRLIPVIIEPVEDLPARLRALRPVDMTDAHPAARKAAGVALVRSLFGMDVKVGEPRFTMAQRYDKENGVAQPPVPKNDDIRYLDWRLSRIESAQESTDRRVVNIERIMYVLVLIMAVIGTWFGVALSIGG